MVTETTIRNLKHYGMSQHYDDLAGPKAYSIILKIAQSLECLNSDADKPGMRHLWIKAKRGSIEEWKTFEEFDECYWDDDSVPTTKEGWQEQWQWELPDETYWHLFQCFQEKEYVALFIDGRCVLRGTKERQTLEDFDKLLNWLNALACSIDQVLLQIREGTYAATIEENLPHSFRWGIIRRKDFWAITGDDGRRFGGRLAEDDALRIAEKLRLQPECEEMAGLQSLTMQQYFQALKGAYIAAGFSCEDVGWRKFDKDDPRLWYCKNGDDRDERLFEIDQNSESALEALLAPDTHLNHGFEVIRGRGCTRVFLAPRKDEDGLWRLGMHGYFDFYAEEMALMWENLNDSGFPTYLHNASELADALLGEDWVFIAPDDEYIDYFSGKEKFGKRVGIAFHLWESYRDELVAAAEWMPLDVPDLRLKKI